MDDYGRPVPSGTARVFTIIGILLVFAIGMFFLFSLPIPDPSGP